MPEERRKSPRAVADVPARLTIGGETVAGRVRDICRDAALVETERSYPIETVVTVETELPAVAGSVRATGRVVRVADGKDGGSAIAILFDNLPAETALRIDLFVSEQEG